MKCFSLCFARADRFAVQFDRVREFEGIFPAKRTAKEQFDSEVKLCGDEITAQYEHSTVDNVSHLSD